MHINIIYIYFKKIKLHVDALKVLLVFSNVTNTTIFFLYATCEHVLESSVLSLFPALVIMKWYKRVKVFATVNKCCFPSPFFSFWKPGLYLKEIKPEILGYLSKLVSKAYWIHFTSENYIIALFLMTAYFLWSEMIPCLCLTHLPLHLKQSKCLIKTSTKESFSATQ